MKILIKESQYYVLLEQNNPNILKAYNEIIKGAKYLLGTAKDTILKAFDYIKNSSDFKTLLLMFKDKKTGYSSFEEMINEEYDRFDYNDIIKLQEKLYSIGVVLKFSKGANKFGNNFFMGNTVIIYDTNFRNRKNEVKVNSDCKSKYTPLLKQAQDYWIKWLSSPITKLKFRKNWNVQPKYDTVDGKKVDDIFEEYIDCINNLKLVFYDNTMIHPPGVSEIDVDNHKNDYAFVTEKTPENVYVNCSQNNDEPLGVLIHEIQHLLYDIKPLNPSIDIGNAFLKPGDKKMGPKDVLGTSNKYDDEIENLIKTSESLGVDSLDLLSWSFKSQIKEVEKPGYVCSTTEKASNIQSMRSLFNINPGQNITPQMLKPYITGEKKDGNISWLLLCWASKGFKDIRLFLADINKLAFQDTKPTDNTKLV